MKKLLLICLIATSAFSSQNQSQEISQGTLSEWLLNQAWGWTQYGAEIAWDGLEAGWGVIKSPFFETSISTDFPRKEAVTLLALGAGVTAIVMGSPITLAAIIAADNAYHLSNGGQLTMTRIRMLRMAALIGLWKFTAYLQNKDSQRIEQFFSATQRIECSGGGVRLYQSCGSSVQESWVGPHAYIGSNSNPDLID